MALTFPRIHSFLILLLSIDICSAQTGSYREPVPEWASPAQRWWNLVHYTINLTPDYHSKSIKGTNEITAVVIGKQDTMQIDLRYPMIITSISYKNKQLPFHTDSASYYTVITDKLNLNDTFTVKVEFEGTPPQAKTPPYSNGWVWTTDSLGRPWMTVTCEGQGAYVWLPCKNVLYDEPEKGVTFTVNTPKSLAAIANGRLVKKVYTDTSSAYTWQVVNPINYYNIIPSIGAYQSWSDKYDGKKGPLDRTFWVIDYNIDKAKAQFKQADTMLKCFEYWLGPYPFYEDGYQLVESPHPGMEHQSAVAYGNKFQNGFLGRDLSTSGWGLKWDFILVHESGHEWFGNSITTRGGEGAWVHEGFTKYLEAIYTDYLYGKEAGNDYAIGIWKRIKNDEPILTGNTSDKYNKGSALLHMIRQITGDDVFKSFLTVLNMRYYHQTIVTPELLALLNDYTKKKFDKAFEQYLETTSIPTFAWHRRKNAVYYRWTDCVDKFDMPIKIWIDNKAVTLYPAERLKRLRVRKGRAQLQVDRNFLVNVKNEKP